MRKEMVILSFVPAAVAQQSALEVLVKSRRAEQRAFHQCVVSEQNTSRSERRGVPDLPVGHASVMRRNQCRTPRDETVAHACSELTDFPRQRAGLEQVEGDNQLKQPDRFEIRTEERTRGTENIVAIRVA